VKPGATRAGRKSCLVRAASQPFHAA
jgi:hypothetical protein